MKPGTGLYVSAAVGAYAAVWLTYSSSPHNLPFVCGVGICRDGESWEAAHEDLLSQDGRLRDRGLHAFSELLRRSPGSPYAWCDFGDALLEAGDIDNARRCFRRAAELGPNVPPVLLRIVNFHCRVLDTPRALVVSRTLLSISNEYDDILFSLFTRLNISVYTVLADGIGSNPRAINAFMNNMLQNSRYSDARSAWRWLGQGSAIEQGAALRYVSTMWQAGHRDESATAWGQRFGLADGGYRRSNFIYNSSFERDSSRSLFDWLLSNEPFADVSIDDTVAFSGARSLRLQFDGSVNPDYVGPRQVVWTVPGKYRFRARLRTESLSSDQGVRFQILDAERPGSVVAETDQVLGDAEWREIGTGLVVGPHLRALEVRLVRRRSWKFDNLLAGTVWIDSVELSPDRGGAD